MVVTLAGCGTPQELSKQADDVHSVAAEGALLAHEAAAGDTLDTFAREHAQALRKLLGKVRPAIEEPRLAAVSDDVDRRSPSSHARPATGVAQPPRSASSSARPKRRTSWRSEEHLRRCARHPRRDRRLRRHRRHRLQRRRGRDFRLPAALGRRDRGGRDHHLRRDVGRVAAVSRDGAHGQPTLETAATRPHISA